MRVSRRTSAMSPSQAGLHLPVLILTIADRNNRPPSPPITIIIFSSKTDLDPEEPTFLIKDLYELIMYGNHNKEP